MHPSLEYALVGLIAAIGSFLCTPLARQIATRWGAVAKPRDRDVHAVDTPRLGGLALIVGFAMAMLIAHALPTLQSHFRNGNEITGVLCGGLIICVLGILDDRYELDSLTKFAGQVMAAAVMSIVGGIQLLYIYVPFGNIGTIPLDRDASVELTILLTVLTINAINFIDGLDGLAAGITAIQGLAFFGYSYHLASVGNTDIALAPTLICAGLVGACVGFLPHNFASARIFMGDSGSMLVGLLLSAAATTASSQADPQSLGIEGSAAAVPAADPADRRPRAPAVRPAAGRGAAAVARPVAVRAGQGASAPPADGSRAHPPARRAAALLLVGGAGLRCGGDVGQQRTVAGAGGGGRACSGRASWPRRSRGCARPGCEPRARATVRRHPLRRRRVLLVPAGRARRCGWSAAPPRPVTAAGRAAASCSGLALAGGALEIGQFNLRLVSQLAPTLSLMMAAAQLRHHRVVLALVSPPPARRVSGGAVALGLVVGVLIWTGV